MSNDAITPIALDDLHESPFNPRQLFDEAALQELATDIASVGRVLQPLLVRPIVPPLFQGDANGQAGFEIVFGHRRYRAARLAGLAVVDCMVRAMTDDEVRRAQISENLQRRDVHPLEEAQGFQSLIDHDNQTADTIAAQFGKSRSHVYGRLKLLQAIPEIRKAFLAGEIDAEVTLLIARLHSAKHQEKALQYIRANNHDLSDGGAKSYRGIKALLADRFTLDLRSAIFDLEDEMLVPLAGHCVRCVKRTGNAPEYEDLTHDVKGRHQGYIFMKGSADTCTDPDCFAEKKKAHLKREADKLAAGGATVVGGNAAKAALSATGQLRNGFVPLADVQKALKKAGKKPDALKMQTVLIQDPRDGKVHKAVKAGAMVEVGLDAPAAASKQSDARYAAERERAKEKEAERELKRQAWQVTNTAVLQRTMTAMAGQPISAEALTWVVEAVFEGLDWPVRQAVAARRNYEHENDLRVAIAQMQPGELALLAVELVLSSDVVVSPWQMPTDDDLVRLNAAARHYGIDPDAVRAEVTGEPISTPSTAARAADKAAAKPTKPKSKGKALRAQEQKDDAGNAGGSDADLFSAAEEAEA